MRGPETTEERNPVVLDYTNATAEAVGPEHGLTPADLRWVAPRLEELLAEMQRSRHQGRPAFLELPSRRDILEEVRALEPMLAGSDAFLLLGIGGSALGPRAIVEAAFGPQHLLAAGRPGGTPRRVFVVDNIDPDAFRQVLSLLDPARTVVNAVSQSGSTLETMAQLALVWKWMGDALGPEERARRFVITTGSAGGFLRELAARHGLASLEVPPGVGGRYSVLTAVGLLPALAAGVDPEVLLEGASDMDERCRTARAWENPAAVLAAVHYVMDLRKGKTVTVMMPYSDRLRAFGDWFCQLWAESLGKSQTGGGEARAPVGQTTVRAAGTTDQHSQVQLFLQGPNDKLITFIAVARPGEDLDLSSPGITDPGLGLEYLRGRTLGEVFRTEQLATEMAMARAERPNLVWRMEAAGPHALGQLFYVYEVACALAGGLYYVNAFDQPGVEDGKNLTYGALGRRGYEEHGAEVERYRDRGAGFTV